MEFKKLELTQESSWLKRTIRSKRFRKSVLYIFLGGLAGFLYFYFTEGKNMNVITASDVFNSAIFGAFLGFFITNSPCARGRC